MLLGLRGVGKTVLLNRIEEMARDSGFETIVLEAPEDRQLAQMLGPHLRSLLTRLSRIERAMETARQGLAKLRAFASVFKVELGDIGFGIQAEAGADTGDLESDLPELLVSVARAAKLAERPVSLFIDELQYLSSKDLGALITSIHKMGQKGLPFLLFGAGLPELAGLAGDAKSYAERLFNYPDVGQLSNAAARNAIRAPIEREGEVIEDAALAMICEQTQGYPYFLQEWGDQAWRVTQHSPITPDDARRATAEALIHLDQGFFRVRLDRLTGREKDYMRAMAALGAGPHRSGDIAQSLGIEVSAAGPLRKGLIRKGMIYSPQYGETAFTVPMFDEFMRRSMPKWSADDHAEKDPRKGRNRGGRRDKP